MKATPVLNIRASKRLLNRLDEYRLAMRKPSRAEAARELLDRALRTFFEASTPELVHRGDPDYRLVRARRRQPAEPFPVSEIEARLARLKQAGIA